MEKQYYATITAKDTLHNRILAVVEIDSDLHTALSFGGYGCMPTTKTTNRDSNVHKFSRKTEQAAADVVSLADEQGIWLPANTQVVVQQKSEKQIRNMYDAAVKREKELSAQIAINRLNILALEQ